MGDDFPLPTPFTAFLQPLLTRFGSAPGFRVSRSPSMRRRSPGNSPLWRATTPVSAGGTVVVPRRAGRDVKVLEGDHRERRLWQIGRLRRRHPGLLLDPRPARPGPPGPLRLLGPPAAEHRIGLGDASELAADFAYRLPKVAFRLTEPEPGQLAYHVFSRGPYRGGTPRTSIHAFSAP